MVRIGVHIGKKGEKQWDEHQFIDLSRVPMVGEYISFELDNSPGFEVKFVNHNGFAHPDGIAAEIFVLPAEAEKTDWSGWQK